MNNNKIDIKNHNVNGDNIVNIGNDNKNKNSNEKKKDSFIIKFFKYIWKLCKNHILKFLF